MRLAYPIIWSDKLRSVVHTMALTLVIASVQALLRGPGFVYVAFLYSHCIALPTWALLDFGRHFYPSARQTGWPKGWAIWAHLSAGVVVGFLVGISLADWLAGWPWATFQSANRAALHQSIVITLICATVASYYFHTRRRSRDMREQVTKATTQAAESKLKLLETQLEPHMMFNTLANLRAMIPMDPEGSQRMLDHMIAYLRATLGGSRNAMHPLQEEFDRLHDYLALMAVRMGARLRSELVLPPELAHIPVPTLLLQPLVENAIKHGLEPSVPGGTLRVTAAKEGAWLVLRVADDGLGVTLPLPPPAHRGFGLVQVHERLGTLYGEQGAGPQQWGMDICHANPDTQRGTVVTLRIPLGSAPNLNPSPKF